jgi:beta-glucanase (GH16 family)
MKSWRNNKLQKAIAISLSLCVVLIASVIVIAPAANAQTTWNLVWSDEFNASSLNTSNWTLETGGGGWGNAEREYYTNGQNLIFNGSTMTIQGRKENPAGYQCWYGTCTHTSSRMKTAGKREFKYGRIEARLAIPTGQGLWPAFWTLGANIGSVGWPRSGEIDIMEHINNETQTHGVIHWDNNGHAQYGGVRANSSVSSFHTYSVEWDSSSIRWYMDGGNFLTANILNNINGTEEFHAPHFILLNLAIGGAWPGDPNSTTTFPANYQIDYVRVYQQGTGGGSTPTRTNTPPPGATATRTNTPVPGGSSQGVENVSSNQARAWYKCSITCSYVIIHYIRPGLSQQNVQMTYNSSLARWEYVITGITSGQVLQYSFTYNDGVQHDTAWFNWTKP